MASKLHEKYKNEVVQALMKELGLKNYYQVPKLEKITLNMGLGEAVSDSKVIEGGVYTLSTITGQKPVVTRSKKAISNFKLRAGIPIGVKVTVRGERMYEFLERLIVAALPRVRDFRGVSGKGFDGYGNYTLGIKEQLIFPEIDYDKIYKVMGMNISIGTTARNDVEGKALLRLLGMPFRN
ncbi:MAG: 50S ribosomal protein L5 [Nitrospinota bacterium]|nr:50S ribosomal protein L5 [Nitrospinota bacterium]